MKKILFILFTLIMVFGISVYADDEVKENTEIENNTEDVEALLDEAVDTVENIADSIMDDETVSEPFEGFFEKHADNIIVKFFKKIIDAITELLNSIFEVAEVATVIEEVPA